MDARVDGAVGSLLVVPDVIHPALDGHVLQLALAVRHAHGADVVALGEQQLEGLPEARHLTER